MSSGGSDNNLCSWESLWRVFGASWEGSRSILGAQSRSFESLGGSWHPEKKTKSIKHRFENEAELPLNFHCIFKYMFYMLFKASNLDFECFIAAKRSFSTNRPFENDRKLDQTTFQHCKQNLSNIDQRNAFEVFLGRPPGPSGRPDRPIGHPDRPLGPTDSNRPRNNVEQTPK